MKCVLCGTSRIKAHFLAGMVLCLGCGHVQRGELAPSPSPEIPMPSSLKELTDEQLTARIEALLMPPTVVLPTDPIQRARAQAALRLNPPPVDTAQLDELLAELQARQTPPPPPPPPSPADTLVLDPDFAARWEEMAVYMQEWMSTERAARVAAEQKADAQHAEVLKELQQLRAVAFDGAQALVEEVQGLRRIGSVAVAILSENASPGLLANFGIVREPSKEEAPATPPQTDNQAPAAAPQVDQTPREEAPATPPQTDNRAPAAKTGRR